jgi:branched-subunit amino acid transport protein
MAKKIKRAKKDRWFIPVRSSYLPNNWKGWLTYIPYTLYLVLSTAVIWNYVGHDFVAVLIIALSAVMAMVAMTWLARKTS